MTEKIKLIEYLLSKGFIEIDNDKYYLDLDETVTERIDIKDHNSPVISVSKNGKYLETNAEMKFSDMKGLESVGLNPFYIIASKILNN